MTKEYETAVFAAGCFWGVESGFREGCDIVDAEVGYTGGHTDNPTYKDICTGDTNHAEAIKIIFDPTRISYEDLIDLFWGLHDPTTLNRQGPDRGTQYRSAIFPQTNEQNSIAHKKLDEIKLANRFSNPVITQIEKTAPFYRAEEQHQRYFEKTGQKGTCYVK